MSGVATAVRAPARSWRRSTHHHQHVNVFHSRVLNRAYDLLLAVQTGVGPYTWVLHHNLGHHQNYLHQLPSATPDESHRTRQDGTRAG